MRCRPYRVGSLWRPSAARLVPAGRVRCGEFYVFYVAAFSAVLDVPPGELFGVNHAASGATAQAGFEATANQFVPVFTGADAVRQLVDGGRFTATELDGTTSWTREVDFAGGPPPRTCWNGVSSSSM